jgi:L-alanine-DL-glutamate epimerase-like enolase superfamily enzyme
MTSLSLEHKPFTLELNHQFTVSGHTRSTTPIVLVTLAYEGITGYGEASLPPYLGETQKSVMTFLSMLNLTDFSDPLDTDAILDYVDQVAPGNNAAKAAVDIALHDLVGKLKSKPLSELWNLRTEDTPLSSFTIGIDEPEAMAQKAKDVKDFGYIKLKLGTEIDREIIKAVREATHLPFIVDVNQGWSDRRYALDMAHFLKEHGVLLLEQPLPKEQTDDLSWLTKHSPLPIVADEGIKRLGDLEVHKEEYSGVNIKLMKSTGLREARKIIEKARQLNMLVLMGCMTETSCAVAAASHLSPLCDYADLDGPFLIKNNPFEAMQVKNGRVVIPTKPGIGVDLI